MADHGNPTPKDEMTLNIGEDFIAHFELIDGEFEPGFQMFYRFFEREPAVEWDFTIAGSNAHCRIESEEADQIPARAKWQLMTRQDGDPTTEIELCWGLVKRSH